MMLRLFILDIINYFKSLNERVKLEKESLPLKDTFFYGRHETIDEYIERKNKK